MPASALTADAVALELGGVLSGDVVRDDLDVLYRIAVDDVRVGDHPWLDVPIWLDRPMALASSTVNARRAW